MCRRNKFRVGERVVHRRTPRWSGTVVGRKRVLPTIRTIRIDGVKRITIAVKVDDLALLPNCK